MGVDKNQKAGENNSHHSSKRKTPHEIVDEHVRNKDDEITEEEFRNMKLDITPESDVAHKPLPIENEKGRPKDENKDHDKLTPWDVLGEL